MKLSLIFAATTAVSAASVLMPRQNISLPSSAFQKFETITLEQAKAGLDVALQGRPVNPANLTVSDIDSNVPGVTLLATSAKLTSAAATCARNLNYRFEWQSYSTSRRLALMKGIKCLMSKKPSGKFSSSRNRYEDLVQLHQQMMPTVHNNALFLIWHRYFLWTFEQILRRECGFSVSFVWWDETKVAGAFAKSDVFSKYYFGRLYAPVGGNPTCVNTGAYAGTITHIGPGQTETTHCLSRGVTETNTAQCNSNFVNYCLQRATYPDFESCWEYGPHGYGHNGIGGVMQDVWSSVGDPIFWMHHAFVDQVYTRWQKAVPSRLTSISGTDGSGKALTLDYVITMGGLAPAITLRHIINPEAGVLIGGTPFCYRYA